MREERYVPSDVPISYNRARNSLADVGSAHKLEPASARRLPYFCPYTSGWLQRHHLHILISNVSVAATASPASRTYTIAAVARDTLVEVGLESCHYCWI